MNVVVIFPGQGAQAEGLGRPWRDHPAWELVERAAKVLDDDLERVLLDAPAAELTRTRPAQLAVLLSSLLAWEATAERQDTRPAAFAGHSMGQITALIAAGVLPFEEGIRVARHRAEATQLAADARPGGMAALLGATPEQAETACAGLEAWVANDNAPGQVVISGTPEGLATAEQRARDLGVRKVMALNVDGAFHTPLMTPAAEEFAAHLADAEMRATDTPVVSNADAVAYTDGEGWRDRLRAHLISPVKWRASQDTLAGFAGTWIEVGPGATLATMAKRSRPDVTVRNVSVPADLEKL